MADLGSHGHPSARGELRTVEEGWSPKGESTCQLLEEGAVDAGQAKPTGVLYSLRDPVFDLGMFAIFT